MKNTIKLLGVFAIVWILGITPTNAKTITPAPIQLWEYTSANKFSNEFNMEANYKRYVVGRNNCERRQYWNPFANITVNIAPHLSSGINVNFYDIPETHRRFTAAKVNYLKTRSPFSFEVDGKFASVQFIVGTGKNAKASRDVPLSIPFSQTASNTNPAVASIGSPGYFGLKQKEKNTLLICSYWNGIAVGNVLAFGIRATITPPPHYKFTNTVSVTGINFLGLKAPKKIDIEIYEHVANTDDKKIGTISTGDTSGILRNYQFPATLDDQLIKSTAYSKHYYRYVVYWDDGTTQKDPNARNIDQIDTLVKKEMPKVIFSKTQFTDIF